MADVDAVNERLNSLVALLQAVGINGVSKDDMDRVSQSLHGHPGNSLNEAQIEQLIRKLQIAQDSAPQIIAALETQGNGSHARSSSRHMARAAAPAPPPPEPEEEDSDSFDEDADYPMVGHGVSDDVSVVSDLTTPTVVSSLHIPEEEHYREGSLPPMLIGGDGNIPSMMIAPPKRKNLVQPQRPGGIAPPPARRASTTARTDRGGAASARLKNYQTTMAKLSEPTAKKGTKKTSGTAAGAAASPSTGGTTKKKVPAKKKTDENFSDLAAARGNDGWGTTTRAKSPRPGPKKKVSSKTPIDDDGFLVSDGFDPFDATLNPFKSSAGDLEFGMAGADPFRADFDAFGSFGMAPARPSSSMTGSGAMAKPRVKKPTQQSSGLQRKAPANAKSTEGRPRRARRASAIS